MSELKIDKNTCTSCGICIKVCPAGCIQLSETISIPEMKKGQSTNCIVCGHCVAVCPSGSISLDSMQSDECVPFQEDQLPSAEEVDLLFKSRRSIRKFTDKVVDHAVFEELLDTARYAPTGGNAQNVSWIVYENPEKLRPLASLVNNWMKDLADKVPDEKRAANMKRLSDVWDSGRDWVLRDAPYLILVHGPKAGAADSVIALTYLELIAARKGLGTCWAGYLTAASSSYAPLIDALDLPKGHVVHGGVMIGYPKYTYKRVPLRKGLKCEWRS
ncbi:MAG: nitroreductase family protein [Bacteroidetes bacterium]|nr:nitroreductase family protein [Bacteroidota bacterium]